jgi:hypothetical protein
MTMTPIRTLLGLLLVAGAAAGQDPDLSWIEKRVEEWQPRPSERKFDLIGWAPDIRAGLALARKHNRPLYLFMHDGRMAQNRCGAGGYTLRSTHLSNDTIISLLNSYFVPVYASNEDYDPKGAAPPDERQAFSKIYTTAANKNLNIGSVRVYICTPDGDPILIGGGTVAEDIEQLKGVIKKLGTREGKPLVPPRPQFTPPKVETDALTLHVTARGLPIGSEAFWSVLPAEDWVVFGHKEWAKLLPPAGAAPGATWEVERDIATKLLSRFYPAEDECLMYEWGRTRKIEYEDLTMKATLLSKERVRLDVSLKMKECFAANHFGFSVAATAVGVIDVDPSKKTIKRFVMATEKATSGGATIGVAVRSLP